MIAIIKIIISIIFIKIIIITVMIIIIILIGVVVVEFVVIIIIIIGIIIFINSHLQALHVCTTTVVHNVTFCSWHFNRARLESFPLVLISSTPSNENTDAYPPTKMKNNDEQDFLNPKAQSVKLWTTRLSDT